MDSLYNYSLIIHSWNRWLIIITGFILLSLLINALIGKKRFLQNINKLALTFIITLHVQLLIGLLLYFFLSPLMQIAFNDFGYAMKNTGIRFWAVEHSLLNVVGIILAQVGYSKAKKQTSERSRQKTMLIWMGIAFIFILIAIPMGIMGVERPWFRI